MATKSHAEVDLRGGRLHVPRRTSALVGFAVAAGVGHRGRSERTVHHRAEKSRKRSARIAAAGPAQPPARRPSTDRGAGLLRRPRPSAAARTPSACWSRRIRRLGRMTTAATAGRGRPGLVRAWLSYAEANCGPGGDAKALSDCHSGATVLCDVIQYLDTEWIYPAGSPTWPASRPTLRRAGMPISPGRSTGGSRPDPPTAAAT